MNIAVFALVFILAACSAITEGEKNVLQKTADSDARTSASSLEKFHLKKDGILILNKTNEVELLLCDNRNPELGDFLAVSYWYDGQWLKDLRLGRPGGKDGLPLDGGYFVNGTFVNFERGFAGDSVCGNAHFPDEITVPFNKEFKFVKETGSQKVTPLTLTYEEWLAENLDYICDFSKPIAHSCRVLDSMESYYNDIKKFRATEPVVPVFDFVQGQSNYLKIEYNTLQPYQKIEEIIKFEDLKTYPK